MLLDEDHSQTENPLTDVGNITTLLDGEKSFLSGGEREGNPRDSGDDTKGGGAGCRPRLLDSSTPLPQAIKQCLQVYYHMHQWRIPFPRHAGAPLLYIPQEVQQLRRDPDCLGVMQSEVDMLSEGVLEQIPLGYYPIRVEELQDGLKAAASTQENIRRMQEQLAACGQLERVMWKPEEVNPALDPEDVELLDTDIDLGLESQRETPSLGQLIKRPMYTETAGGLSAAQRYAARLARLQPASVRQFFAATAAAVGADGGGKGTGADGGPTPFSPLSSNGLGSGVLPKAERTSFGPHLGEDGGSPHIAGGAGVASGLLGLAAAAAAEVGGVARGEIGVTDAARQLLAEKKERWNEEVQRTFRQARTLEKEFSEFIHFIAEKKLGLDGNNPSHIRLTLDIWKAVGDVTRMNHDLTKQACAWGRLCQLSYEYAGPPPSFPSSKASLSIRIHHGDKDSALPSSPTTTATTTKGEGVGGVNASTPWSQRFHDLTLPLFLTVWRPLMQRYRNALDDYVAAGGPCSCSCCWSTEKEGEEKGREGGSSSKGSAGEQQQQQDMKKTEKGGNHSADGKGLESKKGGRSSSKQGGQVSSSSFSSPGSALGSSSSASSGSIITTSTSDLPTLQEVLEARRARLQITLEELELGNCSTSTRRNPNVSTSSTTNNNNNAGMTSSSSSSSTGKDDDEDSCGRQRGTSSPPSSPNRLLSSSSSSSFVMPTFPIGKRFQRQSRKVYFRAQGVNIYPTSVTPVFPSGFEEAAEMLRAHHDAAAQGKQQLSTTAGPSFSTTPLPSSGGYPDLDFLGEDTQDLAQLILPGAVIPEKQCAARGPHVLVHDKTLLCADAEGVRDLFGEGPSSSLLSSTPTTPSTGTGARRLFPLGLFSPSSASPMLPSSLDPEGTVIRKSGKKDKEEEGDATAAAGTLADGSALLYHAFPENTFDPLDIDEDNTSSYLFNFFSLPSCGGRKDNRTREEGSWSAARILSPIATGAAAPAAGETSSTAVESSLTSMHHEKRLPTRQEIRERQFPSLLANTTTSIAPTGSSGGANGISLSETENSQSTKRKVNKEIEEEMQIMKAARRGAAGLDGSVVTYSRVGVLRTYQKAARLDNFPLPQHYAILFSSGIERDDDGEEGGEENEEEEKKNSHPYDDENDDKQGIKDSPVMRGEKNPPPHHHNEEENSPIPPERNRGLILVTRGEGNGSGGGEKEGQVKQEHEEHLTSVEGGEPTTNSRRIGVKRERDEKEDTV